MIFTALSVSYQFLNRVQPVFLGKTLFSVLQKKEDL